MSGGQHGYTSYCGASVRIHSNTTAKHVAHKHKRKLFIVEYLFALVRVTFDFHSLNWKSI